MNVLIINGMNDTLAILDCLDWGVAITDMAGVIQLWNQAAVELTGVAADVAQGCSIYRYFPGLDRGMDPVRCQRGRIPMSMALRWRRPPPHSNTSPHLNEGISAVDESQWVALHVTLRALCSNVSRAAEAEQTQWVWGFQIQPLSLEQAHANFIATVSHEFRTPLTSIKGFVDTLLDCNDRLKPQQQRHFLAVAKSQIERLIRMVEDVLLVSHIQARPFQHRTLQYLSLPETFRRVRADFSPRQQLRLHVVAATDLPAVWAAPEGLDRSLRHIIDNALKYSPDAEPVTISAETHPLGSSWVRVAIVDRGVGIAPERLPDVFTRFRQGTSPLTRDREGTGLGLYIAKSLVESLGGALQLESTLGQGTTCTIWLPSAPDTVWVPPEPDGSEPVSMTEWAGSSL
ncbi:MAG: ATP-binding protein [Cyanobacteria bacterium J06642_2]